MAEKFTDLITGKPIEPWAQEAMERRAKPASEQTMREALAVAMHELEASAPFLPAESQADMLRAAAQCRAALSTPAQAEPVALWPVGTLVRKRSGGQWHGRICGYYTTDLTTEGYAVESLREPGSVQIYPRKALELWEDAAHPPAPLQDREAVVEAMARIIDPNAFIEPSPVRRALVWDSPEQRRSDALETAQAALEAALPLLAEERGERS